MNRQELAIRLLEHLPGKHNQKSHGNRYGSAAAIKGNVARIGKDKAALKAMAQKVRATNNTSVGVRLNKQAVSRVELDKEIAALNKEKQGIQTTGLQPKYRKQNEQKQAAIQAEINKLTTRRDRIGATPAKPTPKAASKPKSQFGFNESEEGGKIIEWKNQSGTLKPGATRDQMARFYKRKSAAQAAQNNRYAATPDGPKNTKELIDNYIGKGFTTIKPGKQKGAILLAHQNGETLRLSKTVERDYALTALNEGDFKRNY